MALAGKTQVDVLNGTPEKRLFLSIISDYDLTTGLCELIDNALDFWVRKGKPAPLVVSVTLDEQRQMIRIEDNAGGVDEADLRLLVAPGASGNDPSSEIIGIFGVGGKRAGVALGSLVEVKTRSNKRTFQIDLNEEWTQSDDWHIAYFAVAPIAKGTTRVDISQLRQSFDDSDIENIKAHFSATYAKFLREGVTLTVNGQALGARGFDQWAYPEGFPPMQGTADINLGLPQPLKLKITGGLIYDRDPEEDNYGVYFYCNGRLVTNGLKSRDVGYYVTGEAGVPHPDASLCRVIVELNGPAEQMPWNSSKSGISIGHPAFAKVRPKIIELTSYYSSLSRRLKYEWDEKVFPKKKGSIANLGRLSLTSGQRLNLPSLPRVRKAPMAETLKALNQSLVKNQPWTLGLIEAVAAVDYLDKARLQTENRIKLILLDSSFEIAMKEFIAKNPSLYPPHKYTDAQLADIMSKRTKAIAEVRKNVDIPQTVIDKAQHYYGLRNKLIHERTTADVSDAVVEDYSAIVRLVLRRLFKVRFPAD